jgi:putative transposase
MTPNNARVLRQNVTASTPNPHPAAVDLASLLDGSGVGELIPEIIRDGLQRVIQLQLAAFLGAS